MIKYNYPSLEKFKQVAVVLTMVLSILFIFPGLSLSRSKRADKYACFQNVQICVQNIQDINYLKNAFWPDLAVKDADAVRRTNPCACPVKCAAYFSGVGSSFPILSKNYNNYNRRYNRLSPEEKAMLKKRYQEWESLPESKRQMLRRRMQKYEQLPPQERERFKQRHRQLQKLPPEERYRIREKLRKWDRLSPEEREQIRQRFRP